MGMGLKGWLGESLLRLWLVTFFVGKGMSLMFRFYIFRYTTGRHTSFSLVVLKFILLRGIMFKSKKANSERYALITLPSDRYPFLVVQSDL